MRNLIVYSFVFASVTASLTPLPAQSITIPPQQCVWRAGDNPTWAAPDIDESSWHPYTQWRLNPGQPRIWVRCHMNLAAPLGVANPALQVSARAAYELYMNGQVIGGAGKLSNGDFSMDTIRSYPAPRSFSPAGPATLAARVTYGYPDFSGYMEASPITIKVGDRQDLDAQRGAEVLALASGNLNFIVYFAIIGVLAFVVFGLFLFDRSRRDLLLLAVYCWGGATIYLTRFFSATFTDYSVSMDLAIYTLAVAAVFLARTWIVFVLAGRRMPLFFGILVAFLILRSAVVACGAFLPLNLSLGLASAIKWSGQAAGQASYYVGLACSFGPFVAFWPYSRIRRSMIPIAAVCMAWGAFMTFFFVSGAATFNGHISRFASFMVSAELFVSICVIILLMSLLFRDQQRTVRERAELAGEMASAREIQQYFIPDKLPPTPDLAIQSVYLPSHEVGGDFFQVLPDLRDGSTLIVVGDVAGKGLRAGMLSALIVGAIRTASQFTRNPAEILDLLNQRLQGRGIVTCLALRIHRSGIAELANAGHLAPYLNGNELAIEGALPLGAVADVEFPVTRLALNPSDSLVLMTDGIVEAKDLRGQLFGFDRVTDLLGSGASGNAIASAARAHGQDDDITVLTLTRLPLPDLATEQFPTSIPSIA